MPGRYIIVVCIYIYIYIYTFISICLCISACMCICYIYNVVDIPWNAREIHHIHIYIPISLCVCFKATYMYYTYFASSPRNVREIYTNIYIYCVCMLFIHRY